MEHLHPEARPYLEKSLKERKNHILDRKWIGYPKAKYILNKMEELLENPVTHRMPNILLVGDTNNGKTMIVDKFSRLYPAVVDQENGGIKSKVLYVQAPPIPDEKRLYNNILDKVYTPYRINDRVEKKQNQVFHVLKHIKLRVLIIDEIQHTLAGSALRQRSFLNVIKFMANELQISIVGVGIRDAFNAIHSDPQLGNRFETIHLNRWQMDEEYKMLLASFEKIIPLKKPSMLTSDELSIKILTMGEGILGEISNVIKKAAIMAIESGEERITMKILQNLDWRSPSERKVLSYHS